MKERLLPQAYRIRNRNAQQHNEMLDGLPGVGRGLQLISQPGKNELICLRIVDLASSSLAQVSFSHLETPASSGPPKLTSVRASMPRRAMRAPSLANMLEECSATEAPSLVPTILEARHVRRDVGNNGLILAALMIADSDPHPPPSGLAVLMWCQLSAARSCCFLPGVGIPAA